MKKLVVTNQVVTAYRDWSGKLHTNKFDAARADVKYRMACLNARCSTNDPYDQADNLIHYRKEYAALLSRLAEIKEAEDDWVKYGDTDA